MLNITEVLISYRSGLSGAYDPQAQLARHLLKNPWFNIAKKPTELAMLLRQNLVHYAPLTIVFHAHAHTGLHVKTSVSIS